MTRNIHQSPSGTKAGLAQLGLASLIWGFSFGLIGSTLSSLPVAWTAAARLLTATLAFAPFAKRLNRRAEISLMFVGAIQFGFMYLAYMASFKYLKSYEVALFTLTTPIYVTIANDLLARRVYGRNHLAALLAIGGAAVVVWRGMPIGTTLTGLLLVQLSNLLFAAGQLGYRFCFASIARSDLRDRHVMFWLYLGGLLVLLPMAQLDKPASINHKQISALLYLGIVASGGGFFLWNFGARRVTSGTLAVANNLKVPVAVAVSVLLFRETVNLVSLLAGSLLIIAAFLSAKDPQNRK